MHKPEIVKHKYKGVLIYIEGGDGAGKTTLARLLAEAVQKTEQPVWITKEPQNSTAFGMMVRAIYQNKFATLKAEVAQALSWTQGGIGSRYYVQYAREHAEEFCRLGRNFLELPSDDKEHLTTPSTQMFLQLGMLFDREMHHRNVLIPRLAAGNTVISDRCSWSTFAYAKANGIDWRYLVRAHNDVLGEQYLEPDLLLFLDVSPEKALERKTNQGSSDLFESEHQIQRHINAYRFMYADYLFPEAVRIDADQDEEAVFQEAWKHTQNIMSKNKDRG